MVVMMFMGAGLFMFGIPLKMDIAMDTSADIYSSFWLGILYFTCGVLYILSERQPSKKIITASFALSILSTLGSIVASIDFITALSFSSYHHFFYPNFYYEDEANQSNTEAVMFHYMPIYSLEAVFLFNSLLGGIILIIMTVYARMALRSSRTQAVVVMRNLPATE
ncbi:uncharacterized protein [Salminus brasiliensis]|uniref:uncharacterized protein isoform X2 n=1 Tax=Salminus brasiliensis TaxID=930266 RepID=UPI003B832BDB